MATTAGQMYCCGYYLGFLINTKNIHFTKDHQRKVPVKCDIKWFPRINNLKYFLNNFS
jgi:hypothetical protein